MHIEIWEQEYLHRGGWHWYWHFEARNGRIVADAEAFPTKAHAKRAAKAAVRAIVRRCRENADSAPPMFFESKSKAGRIVLRWS